MMSFWCLFPTLCWFFNSMNRCKAKGSTPDPQTICPAFAVGPLFSNAVSTSSPTPLIFTLMLSTGWDKKMVATHLRCCGIFGDNVITNFLLILTVKDFENRLIFDKVKRFNINCAIFWPTLYKSPLSRPHGYFSKYLGLCNVHVWHYTVTISYAYITLTCYFIKGASFDERCVAPWRPAFYFVCK